MAARIERAYITHDAVWVGADGLGRRMPIKVGVSNDMRDGSADGSMWRVQANMQQGSLRLAFTCPPRLVSGSLDDAETAAIEYVDWIARLLGMDSAYAQAVGEFQSWCREEGSPNPPNDPGVS